MVMFLLLYKNPLTPPCMDLDGDWSKNPIHPEFRSGCRGNPGFLGHTNGSLRVASFGKLPQKKIHVTIFGWNPTEVMLKKTSG